MATEFLKRRHAAFLAETAGLETVQYIPFDDAGRDELTGEITDEDATYGATPVGLPALVDFSPSDAMRLKIGQEIDFDALIRVPTENIEENEITINIGDAFVLPGSEQKYYVVKVLTQLQTESGFLESMIAVSRKVGRRG
jgi:hypothetical protein